MPLLLQPAALVPHITLDHDQILLLHRGVHWTGFPLRHLTRLLVLTCWPARSTLNAEHDAAVRGSALDESVGSTDRTRLKRQPTTGRMAPDPSLVLR